MANNAKTRLLRQFYIQSKIVGAKTVSYAETGCPTKDQKELLIIAEKLCHCIGVDIEDVIL